MPRSLLIKSFPHPVREECMRFPLLIIALCLCSLAILSAQVDQPTKAADSDGSALNDDKIISGLKEALEVSASKAIAVTGKHDGFLQNEDIRILLPPKLQAIGKSMRMIGSGEQVDEFEISMNRAAEQATPQARQIFLDTIKKTTFNSPRKILSGNETAATDYFRQINSDDISAAFTPIVHHALEHFGAFKQYDHVIKSAPGGNAIATEFDLDKYVVEETLNGIFSIMGAEESKIRRDPSSQTTDLEKQLFGGK
jgi:Protein of unknown function (DUF4197)